MILPAAATAIPIYIPAVLLLGLLGFITIIAWATRATAVAFLAVGLCIVAGGMLALWTSYLHSVQEPFEPFDVVMLRFLAAAFVGMLMVQLMVAKRCWQADRARWNARRAAELHRRPAAEDFNQQWLLSLLQKKVAETREKVSTSAAGEPSGSEAASREKFVSS